MIDYLRGNVVHLEADYIVMDVRDIGYRIFTPNPYQFANQADSLTTVYIHYNVREDATWLYGFATREEQSLFRRLIEVTGIGPKVALGILSGAQPEAVVAAIQQENIAFLIKLPGIGKKTAQRIILDLKDKLAHIGFNTGLFAADVHNPGQLGSTGELSKEETAWEEAREALAALGYTAAELDKAWNALQKDDSVADETVDALMKRALQQLFKG